MSNNSNSNNESFQDENQASNDNNYNPNGEEEDNINPEDLADQAGETIFKNIYTKVKSEIKDSIITKLLYKIERQEIKIQELENENKKLKDDYTYVLKRILSTKNDYSDSNKKNNNMNNCNSVLTYTSNKKYRTNILMEDNGDFSEMPTEEITEKQSNDMKIKKYLNNLYRKNIANTIEGTGVNHYLSKNISVADELFPKKPLNNSYVRTNNNTTGNNNMTPCSTYRNNSAQRRKDKKSFDLKMFQKAIIANSSNYYVGTNDRNNSSKKRKVKYYQGNSSTGKKWEKNYKNVKKNENNGKNIKINRKYNVMDSNDPKRKLKYNYIFKK